MELETLRAEHKLSIDQSKEEHVSTIADLQGKHEDELRRLRTEMATSQKSIEEKGMRVIF